MAGIGLKRLRVGLGGLTTTGCAWSCLTLRGGALLLRGGGIGPALLGRMGALLPGVGELWAGFLMGAATGLLVDSRAAVYCASKSSGLAAAAMRAVPAGAAWGAVVGAELGCGGADLTLTASGLDCNGSAAGGRGV